MSKCRERFRSRSTSLRWLSTALIMSVIARGTETRPAATFCPAKNQSAAREAVSQKFWRRSGNAELDEGYFKQNLSLETLRATIRRTIRMVRASDDTARCFVNDPFVN